MQKKAAYRFGAGNLPKTNRSTILTNGCVFSLNAARNRSDCGLWTQFGSERTIRNPVAASPTKTTAICATSSVCLAFSRSAASA